MIKICIHISVGILPINHSLFLDRLEDSGFNIGQRVIELIACRDRNTKRETRIVNMLQVYQIHIICVTYFFVIVHIKCRVEISVQ